MSLWKIFPVHLLDPAKDANDVLAGLLTYGSDEGHVFPVYIGQ